MEILLAIQKETTRAIWPIGSLLLVMASRVRPGCPDGDPLGSSERPVWVGGLARGHHGREHGVEFSPHNSNE